MDVRSNLATIVGDFRRHGRETAIVSHRGNRSYRTSYGDLAVMAGRFAAELDRSGITFGERIVLWGENSAEWVAAFFGCLLRGVVAVPLDAGGTSDFTGRVIADVAPRLILGDAVLLRTLTSSAPQRLLSEFQRRLPEQPSFNIHSEVSADTPFQIIFTSGTTSEPKGIVHTHRNVLASLEPIETEIAKYRKYERLVHPLRFLHTLPLSHVFGQFMGLWIPPSLAAEVHFNSQLEPARMVYQIHRERISVLIAVPRVLHLLRTHLLGRFVGLEEEIAASQDASWWKRWWRFRRVHRTFGYKFWALICGGASLPADLESFWNCLGVALIQGYGMTETAALVTLNHPFRISHGTIGKALPGREVRLENGEILVRGDMLSAATWKGGRMQPREQEWLATGDLAEQDAQGEFRFVGRKGDVIVTPSGMNIHPSDLEIAVVRQAGVQGCVVVSCVITGGTEPVAVVLFSGSDSELQSAIGAANRELANYQQIRRFLRWPDLNFPYTSTGKLLRRKVAEWACEMLADRQLSPAQQSVEKKDILIELIASLTGESIANGDDNQRLSEDLHLDSLGRVQLQSILEQRIGVELSDQTMASLETLGELRALVGTASHTNAITSTPVTGPLQAAKEAQQIPGSTSIPLGKSEMPGSSTPAQHRYPHWPWLWPMHLIRNLFVELVMRPLIWLLAAPKVIRDSPRLPPGPYLLIANHVTAYDGPLILYALPFRLRYRIAIAMSGEMLLDFREHRNQGNWWKNALGPLAYWLLTALFNTFPLPRLQGFRRSFAHAGEALDRGYSVLIFPEGHRSSSGGLQPFRPGIGILAHESMVPVLPMALLGLDKLRGESRWFRSGRLSIHIGKPISVEETVDPAELTRLLEDAVRSLGNTSSAAFSR